MFELVVQDAFSAAHRVKGYKGDCADIHGHTYKIEVRIGFKKLDRLGMTMDFRRIKRTLKKLLGELDHKNLNNLPFFKRHNATTEWIAAYIYKRLKTKIKNLKSVTVWEGYENRIIYYEE